MTVIRAALPTDVGAVQAVAVAAGERFRNVADPRIAGCADDPPPPGEELLELIEGGRLLVADSPGTAEGPVVADWSGVAGVPREVVGFAALGVVDGRAHVEEVSVAPGAQGRGHGVALLDAVQRWAEELDLDGVTLTTFRDVEWNRPFYERRGFVVLADADVTPGLRDLMTREATLGLDPELRVAMWRPST